MNKINRSLIILSILTLVLSSCGNENRNEIDGTVVEQEHLDNEANSKVIFENDFAKVTKFTLAPTESLATHNGEERVIYSLSDYSIDWEEQGEKLGAKSRKMGDVHFHEAGTHAAQNNGTTAAEWIVFTRKDGKMSDCDESKVTAASPDFSKLLLDNESFSVTKILLPKGMKIPMHSGINRVIYSLSDYKIIYNTNKGSEGEKQMKAGDIHWHEDCQHAIENIGDTDAEYLVVSYKKK